MFSGGAASGEVETVIIAQMIVVTKVPVDAIYGAQIVDANVLVSSRNGVNISIV